MHPQSLPGKQHIIADQIPPHSSYQPHGGAEGFEIKSHPTQQNAGHQNHRHVQNRNPRRTRQKILVQDIFDDVGMHLHTGI